MRKRIVIIMIVVASLLMGCGIYFHEEPQFYTNTYEIKQIARYQNGLIIAIVPFDNQELKIVFNCDSNIIRGHDSDYGITFDNVTEVTETYEINAYQKVSEYILHITKEDWDNLINTEGWYYLQND